MMPPAGRLAALLAMVFALVGQLAAGSVVLPDQVTAERMAALDAASVLCGAPHRPGTPHGGEHRPVSLLAVLSVQLHGSLPSPAIAVPAVGFVVLVAGVLPPVRGPLAPIRTGQPRAPPLPV